MSQPGAIVVSLVIDEDLGLVFEPPERLRMDYSIAVPLEARAKLTLGLFVLTTLALHAKCSIRGQNLRLMPLIFLSGKHAFEIL
jgi:hypothetical protein